MSAVAFVAPSGDVMFATSLGLSDHPSPLPPLSIQRRSSLLVSLSLHTFELSRQQSAMFVITSGYTRPGLSISRPSVPKEFRFDTLKKMFLPESITVSPTTEPLFCFKSNFFHFLTTHFKRRCRKEIYPDP